MKVIFGSLLLFTVALTAAAGESPAPVRMAVVGLAHVHAMTWIPRMTNRSDLQLVGIVEGNKDIAARYQAKFKLNPNLFYPTLDALLARTNAQAVFSFVETREHEQVVKMCAARHLDVMIEKPMALDAKQARAMVATADKAGIRLVVNY
jgi:predicted dehydrogenase